MKAIKLWEITEDEKGFPSVKPLDGIEQTKTENMLEETIVRCPDLLYDELKLVGRQTETAGGPLDLLGVDNDGNLVVFELKRGTLTREAVSQIVDYASYLSELEPEELSKHISERSGNHGIEKIDDFLAWYQEEFAKSFSNSQKPRMVLVGLGADDRTRRMVSFLADSDLDVSLITFYGFEKNGKTFLSKQIEVEAKLPKGTPSITKMDNLEKLQERVKKLGIEEYYYELAAFFRDQLPVYEWPNPGGYSYSLPELTSTGSESNRVYVALYIYENQPGRVKIQFYPRAVETSPDGFKNLKENLSKKVVFKPDGSSEIWIESMHDWENIKSNFKEICPKIISGWKAKKEKQSLEEFKDAEREIDSKEEGKTSDED